MAEKAKAEDTAARLGRIIIEKQKEASDVVIPSPPKQEPLEPPMFEQQLLNDLVEMAPAAPETGEALGASAGAGLAGGAALLATRSPTAQAAAAGIGGAAGGAAGRWLGNTLMGQETSNEELAWAAAMGGIPAPLFQEVRRVGRWVTGLRTFADARKNQLNKALIHAGDLARSDPDRTIGGYIRRGSSKRGNVIQEIDRLQNLSEDQLLEEFFPDEWGGITKLSPAEQIALLGPGLDVIKAPSLAAARKAQVHFLKRKGLAASAEAARVVDAGYSIIEEHFMSNSKLVMNLEGAETLSARLKGRQVIKSALSEGKTMAAGSAGAVGGGLAAASTAAHATGGDPAAVAASLGVGGLVGWVIARRMSAEGADSLIRNSAFRQWAGNVSQHKAPMLAAVTFVGEVMMHAPNEEILNAALEFIKPLMDAFVAAPEFAAGVMDTHLFEGPGSFTPRGEEAPIPLDDLRFTTPRSPR